MAKSKKVAKTDNTQQILGLLASAMYLVIGFLLGFFWDSLVAMFA